MSIAISTFNLDSLGFIALYSPTNNTYKVDVINNSSVLMYLRSNPADSNSEISLLPGELKSFESIKNTAPYNTTVPLIYAKLASSTGNAKVVAH